MLYDKKLKKAADEVQKAIHDLIAIIDCPTLDTGFTREDAEIAALDTVDRLTTILEFGSKLK